eukprot:5097228-Alexandrium_andersonii.AAC.1
MPGAPLQLHQAHLGNLRASHAAIKNGGGTVETGKETSKSALGILPQTEASTKGCREPQTSQLASKLVAMLM